MNSKPVYKVTAITRYINGDIHNQDDRYFYTMKQAVAHAEHVSLGAEEHNGQFDSGWKDNWQITFLDDPSIVPAKLRIIATITTITMADVPDLT